MTDEHNADYGRLLGAARMVLDRCAEQYGDTEAGRVAQQIVNLIGHPVTDEPPHALVDLEEALERVLVKYHVPPYLVYDAILGMIVADRGDLTSDLAEQARHILTGVPLDVF